ncbi:MAG: hypothetical protein IJK97_00565 [Thermoguttaceae bacterium]|nr:hypothetical protein [Thermoguttaceae bacterium]MBR0192929.1 hypothetical protein [Thermoguttaceae bacterium]
MKDPMSDEKESDLLADDDLFPILGQCPEEGVGDSRESLSCASCPLSDCPSRGLIPPERLKAIQDAEKSAPLTPAQMTFSSLAVFVLPILTALAGVVFLTEWTGPVPAALIGFAAGVIIARVFYH